MQFVFQAGVSRWPVSYSDLRHRGCSSTASPFPRPTRCSAQTSTLTPIPLVLRKCELSRTYSVPKHLADHIDLNLPTTYFGTSKAMGALKKPEHSPRRFPSLLAKSPQAACAEIAMSRCTFVLGPRIMLCRRFTAYETLRNVQTALENGANPGA